MKATKVLDFLSTCAIEVYENEPSSYVELMMDNHKCVEYPQGSGQKYYIPEDTGYFVNEEVYDYLIEYFLI